MTLENIIGKLENVKQRGEGYAHAKCPAHNDDGESLTLTVLTNGEVSLMCLNGCTEESIRGVIEAKSVPDNGDEAQTANGKQQSTRIIELALSITSDLWHTPEGDAYATMESESLLLTSREFQQSLEYQFYQREKTPATSKAINRSVRRALRQGANRRRAARDTYTTRGA